MIGFAPWLLLLASVAQDTAPPPDSALTFRLQRDGMTVPLYVIHVGADGQSAYWEGNASLNENEVQENAIRRITVSPATIRLLFAAVPTVKTGHCETKAKHLAQTGRKTLLFTAQQDVPSCDYNYSDDEKVNSTGSAFEAIANTLQTGDRLKHLLRYDRLGLDAEFDNLTNALSSHQALEVQNIAPVLENIIQDERVLERVRRKAARMLQDAGVDPVDPSGSAR